MNYAAIANLVHECVKNPTCLVIQKEKSGEKKINPGEFSIVQNVLSRHDISGNGAAIGVLPLGYWA
ncbi:hypothetical protein SDC9_13276 [bioreactor metagenome]|uniref:Uncharacterized protein n=1 Tax=bioreactor metagenome TaxID=1076179 RepID=A0A644TKU6_9ZZZZ|nr:hypothetical protein [Desulfitobacterium hafniense]MEA5022662.1 hypothetical protein [Desulfitobacterium hafniense]